MRHSRERGMATAEYSVGVLGAVVLAGVMFKLGVDDGWFADGLRDIIEQALRPGALIEHLRNIPKLRIGGR